jgi:prepilin-type N-terminal cleavage/methylation domain-containing protein
VSRGSRPTVGFTLLETLVALAITAIVLAALGGSVLRAAVARTRATAVADRLAASRTLLVRIAAEVEAARTPLAADPAGPERFVVAPNDTGLPWSVLRLATAVAGPGAAGDVRGVTYEVQPDAHRPGIGVLVRRDGPPTAVAAATQPVLTGVRTFAVRCFDGTTWSGSWPAGRLPRAVAITLGVDDGHGGSDELAVTVAPALAG